MISITITSDPIMRMDEAQRELELGLKTIMAEVGGESVSCNPAGIGARPKCTFGQE